MKSYSFWGKPYAFSVCRIEPENNIHILLEAFAENAAMPLVTVGNWMNSEYGRDLLKKYRDKQNIFQLSPIYDQIRLNELRLGCTLYLHGHSCGGTNPSLVEAMYLGLPIVAFDVNFNRETTENKALYFRDAEELKNICGSIEAEASKKIGDAMKEIADRRYTWQRISECYAKLM